MKTKIIKTLSLLIWLALSVAIYAQQQPYNQFYLLDESVVNPAIAGKKSLYEIGTTINQSMVGQSKAPGSYYLGGYGRYGKKSGLGASIHYDNNGLNNYKALNLSYAHHVNLGNRGLIRESLHTLSFGLAITGEQNTVEQDKFTPVEYDPALSFSKENFYHFNARIGIIYQNNNYRAGLVVSDLIPYLDEQFSNYTYTNLAFYTGYLFTVAERIQLEPILYVYMIQNMTPFMDMNLKVIYKPDGIEEDHQIWYTVSYKRSLNNIAGENLALINTFGLNLNNYSVGYAFQMGLSNMQRHHYGAHTLCLKYRIPKKCSYCPSY